MIRAIARKEFRETVRDGRLLLIGAIIWILLLAGGVAGLVHTQEMAEVREEAQAAERVRWLEQDPTHPHSAAHFGVYVFRPSGALAPLDPGVDAYTGVAVWLEAHRQNEMLYRPVRDATPLERFGRLHVALVVTLLLPLVVFLLAFGAFCGERERGTLRQVLSLGISPVKLLFGKFLGIGVVVGLFLLPAVLVAIAAVALGAPVGDRLDAAFRAGLWAMAAVVYLSACLFVALAVSALAPSSRAALGWLLLFWVFNGLVAPRMLADVASRAAPLPATQEFYANLEADILDTEELDEQVSERLEELFQEHNVDAISDLPFNFMGMRLQMDEEYFNELFDRYYGGLYSRIEEQNWIMRQGGLLAPYLAMQSISMGLAGTDFQAQRHFSAAAEEYRREIQIILNEAIMERPTRVGEQIITGRELWEEIPEFHYEPPSTGGIVRAQAPGFGILALWLLASMGMARVAVGRIKAVQ